MTIDLHFNALSPETPAAPPSDISRPRRPVWEPNIGDKMPDGTVYAGISPDTGGKMYASPADALLARTFNAAADYAKKLNQGKYQGKYLGHNDWRVPTKGELNVLFNNRAAIGGFNVSRSNPSGWYWSSSSYLIWFAWGQSFSDGYQGNYDTSLHASVRLVR